ncbi:MAG: hypothetical protein LBS44_05800 [Deltaproteobacteria bacterium]|jgi:hypothetical protein|nr:hypothetical protein [Deltaproteobacteria bacterium]
MNSDSSLTSINIYTVDPTDKSSKNGRLFVFPDICPSELRPPQPCLYLTWPAWESFRQEQLGQNLEEENLIPLQLPDPPAFKASLMSLLESASHKEANSAFASLAGSGLKGRETLSSLARAIRGDPKEPYAHEWPHEESVERNQSQTLEPAYLILALGAVAKNMKAQADELYQQALVWQQELMDDLRGVPDGETDVETDVKVKEWEQPEPPPLTAIFSAWLKLARPLLTPLDCLWTPVKSHREDAAEAINKAGLEVRLWSERE